MAGRRSHDAPAQAPITDVMARRLRDAASTLVSSALDLTSPRQWVELANDLETRTDKIKEGKDPT